MNTYKPSMLPLIVVLVLLALPGTIVKTVNGGLFDSWGGRRVGYSGGYFQPEAYGPPGGGYPQQGGYGPPYGGYPQDGGYGPYRR